MRHAILKMAAMAVLLVMTAVVVGCNLQPDRVTRENYDKLKAFMSYEEACDILGEPLTEASRFGLKEHTWVENGRHIHIKFFANRAVYFSSKGLEQPKAGEQGAVRNRGFRAEVRSDQ